MTDRTASERFRPALVSLATDQRELKTELIDGLDSRRDVLSWLQRLAVRTLGTIPDEWFRALAMRPDMLQDLTSDDQSSRFKRGLIADNIVHPRCHDAYHRLRTRAHEYLDHNERSPDPDAQEFIAMRPSLSEMDALQAEVIRQTRSPFPDRDAVREWAEQAHEATDGQLPSSWLTFACYAPQGYDALTGMDSAAAIGRENIVGIRLLPAMNAGVRALQSVAGERVEEYGEGISVANL